MDDDEEHDDTRRPEDLFEEAVRGALGAGSAPLDAEAWWLLTEEDPESVEEWEDELRHDLLHYEATETCVAVHRWLEDTRGATVGEHLHPHVLGCACCALRLLEARGQMSEVLADVIFCLEPLLAPARDDVATRAAAPTALFGRRHGGTDSIVLVSHRAGSPRETARAGRSPTAASWEGFALSALAGATPAPLVLGPEGVSTPRPPWPALLALFRPGEAARAMLSALLHALAEVRLPLLCAGRSAAAGTGDDTFPFETLLARMETTSERFLRAVAAEGGPAGLQSLPDDLPAVLVVPGRGVRDVLRLRVAKPVPAPAQLPVGELARDLETLLLVAEESGATESYVRLRTSAFWHPDTDPDPRADAHRLRLGRSFDVLWQGYVVVG